MSDVKQENVENWLELLRGFDQARGHFAESYRHGLLGVAETVRVFQQMAEDPRVAALGGGPVVSLLDLIRRGLELWAQKIPALLEATSLDIAKREALVTVKEVLLAEIYRVSESEKSDDESRVRSEALEAILRVIDIELDRSAATANAGARRVVIE